MIIAATPLVVADYQFVPAAAHFRRPHYYDRPRYLVPPRRHRQVGSFSFGALWFSIFLLPIHLLTASAALIARALRRRDPQRALLPAATADHGLAAIALVVLIVVARLLWLG